MALSGWNEKKKIQLTIPAAKPTNVNDYFTGDNDEVPNDALWHTTPNDFSLDIQDNKLVAYINAVSSYVPCKVDAKFNLSGDFDIQVDFDMLNVQTAVNFDCQIIMYSLVDSADSVYLRRRYNSGDFYYGSIKIDGVPTAGSIATTDLVGKLRIVRSGTVLTCYKYNDGWDQVVIHETYPTDDMSVQLTCYAYDNAVFEWAWDNFIVNSGTIVWSDYPLENFPVLLNIAENRRLDNVNDYFTGTDNDLPNELIWKDISVPDDGSSGLFSIISNKLHATYTTSSTQWRTVTLKSRFLLSGDFSIQVDFDSYLPAGVNEFAGFTNIYTNSFFAAATRDGDDFWSRLEGVIALLSLRINVAALI